MSQFYVDLFGVVVPPGQREAMAEVYFDSICAALGGPTQVMQAFGRYVGYYEAGGAEANVGSFPADDDEAEFPPVPRPENLAAWPEAASAARAVALGPDLASTGGRFWCSFFGDMFEFPGLASRDYQLRLDGADALPPARRSTVLSRYARALDQVAAGPKRHARSRAALTAADGHAWLGIERPAGAVVAVHFDGEDEVLVA